jgi:alpha-beta hydrolase superfamily lysophospholipase
MVELGALNVFRENPSWRHQLLRLLAEVSAGGGDFFEIMETAGQIKLNDENEWHAKWYELGSRNDFKGDEAENNGESATARLYFLRAANYYRMSDFYLGPDDPKEIATYDKTVLSFQRASKHFDHSFELVDVPFEGVRLPAYLLGVQRKERAPVVILMGGADSLKEEYYFRGAQECVERGMSCLLIDGPGQGAPLRKHRMHIRYDYEKPLSAIIDYLQTRADVHPRKIGYVASRLGGYFAARVAAYEKLIVAAVAWSACYDVLEDIYNFFPPIQNRIRHILGADGDKDAREKLKPFTLKGSLQQVSCPLLIVHGEEDYVCSPSAALKVYDELTGPKTLKMYRKGELGSLHAQQDNLDETKAYIFDWMHEKLVAPS